MYSFQALQILVFLIPGFISSSLLNALIVRESKKGDTERIIEALIFSMLIYLVYSTFDHKNPIALVQTSDTLTYSYETTSFLSLLVISIFLPLVFGVLITNDLHMKVARKLRISTRTSRSSVWFDVFCDQKKHVIIDFENGRRLYGWPMYYSDTPEQPYVFIHRPCWIQDDKFVDTGLLGMLITPAQKIEAIEFLDE